MGNTNTNTNTNTNASVIEKDIPVSFSEFRRVILDNAGKSLTFSAVKTVINTAGETSRSGILRYHCFIDDTAQCLPLKQVYRKMLLLAQDNARNNALYMRFSKEIDALNVPDDSYVDFTLKMDKTREISKLVFIKIFELFRKKILESFSIKENEKTVKIDGVEVTKFYFKVDEKAGNIIFRIFGAHATISKKAIVDFQKYQQATAK